MGVGIQIPLGDGLESHPLDRRRLGLSSFLGGALGALVEWVNASPNEPY